MTKFVIDGGRPLVGEVAVSGSKNAALPILAATLLTDEECVLSNVPDIKDVRTMLRLLERLGSEVSFEKNTVRIRPRLKFKKLPDDLTCTMRASVLLLGPLLARLGKAEIPQPGGCVLGKRSFETHLDAFTQLGAIDRGTPSVLRMRLPAPSPLSAPLRKKRKIVLKEMSVTATENILMALALTPGKSEVHLAAMEPHVQDLCRFLNKMGARIIGIGTPRLTIRGRKKLRGAKHSITPDYLEAATFVLAALLTRGRIVVKKMAPSHLTAFFATLKKMGARFSLGKNRVEVFPSENLASYPLIKTAPHPGFPTDLQSPFAVLLTQCRGESRIHETLFEGRLNYLEELKKMKAKIEILNEHEALISGPVKLRPAKIVSHNIRAGVAMILAALAAKGRSVVSDIPYVDRGYERFDERLNSLGARIKRVD